MRKSIFSPVKHQVSFNEYMQETLITAKRIREVAPGKQPIKACRFVNKNRV
ncbi:hypothetical protein [Legionella fallonii]|nr:hypothetical protein [Legionella fallonii]